MSQRLVVLALTAFILWACACLAQSQTKATPDVSSSPPLTCFSLDSRGEDAVIGVVETDGRSGITELATKLETVSCREGEYKGATFDEMDLDAILVRKMRIVLVDEFAHTILKEVSISSVIRTSWISWRHASMFSRR